MNISDLTVDQMKKGFRYDAEHKKYSCCVCNAVFEEGEIYPLQDRFFSADKAIEKHIETEHPDYFQELLDNDSKYNTLTDNQKELLSLFAAGVSDRDIAARLGITASTVRHQKFMFREKAKQAKMYLAVYESAFDRKEKKKDDILPVHDHATMLDDRYIITEKEKEQVLKNAFSSLEPLRLKMFPVKEKKKLVILTKIAGQFTQGQTYTEKQVNEVLKEIYEDFAEIRRYLIMYGFMERSADGSEYRLK